MDHCIAFFRKKNNELLYRVYVTDSLKAIADNTMKMFGGASMKKRYAELINSRKEKEDSRTAEDIISNIKSKINKIGG